MTPAARGHRLRLVLAFAAIYVIWGSSYLGILWAIEDIPPFLMAGVRFLAAGAALYAWARARGAPDPTAREWRGAALLGALFLLGGNGLVTWSEQRVPSGIAAVLIASVPAWVVALEAVRPGGRRPGPWTITGVLLGLAGIVWLVGPAALSGAGAVDPIGAAVLMLACLSWSTGTVSSRAIALPRSPALTAAMQMLAGGALLVGAGVATGEPARFDPGAVSLRAGLALVYLIVFASILAFTAYGWLLRHVPPARVATYAFVNPIVAVLLGWALAGETVGPSTLAAAALIVAGVALVTLAPAPRTARSAPAPREAEAA